MKILVVYNGYASLAESSFQKMFDEIWRSKHGDALSFQFLKIEEDESIHGNLLGFVEAHKKILRLYTDPTKFPDSIVYIHDAGLSKRIFPLQFSNGKPSKALIKLPKGPAIFQMFSSMSHNLPFLKNTVMIIPIDQYYSYTELGVEKLKQRLQAFGMVMLQVAVPVQAAAGHLGVTELNQEGKVISFYEKPKDLKVIPQVREGITLANTFQMFLTYSGFQKLTNALDDFRKNEKELSKELDKKGWDFNVLVSEALVWPAEKMNQFQKVFKKYLLKHKTSLGGLEVRGGWQDWASSPAVYFEFVKAHASQAGVPDPDGNIWIRTDGIKKVTGNIKGCVFIDCNTVDLHGDFQNCIFVNCQKCRVSVSETAEKSLFYNLQETNSLFVELNQELIAWGKTGKRKIFSVSGFHKDYKTLYDGPGSFVKGWEKK